MLEIKHNYSLKLHNTFGIDVKTDLFADVSKPEQIVEIVSSDIFKEKSHLILGGGSNILFTKDFNGIILHSSVSSVELLGEDEISVLIKAGSGENWDEFVGYCLNNNWGGLENLTKIPGNVGAAPVQNIGAYGAEVKNLIETVEGVNLSDGKKYIFSVNECEFGYRTSIFKQKLKNDFFITYVTFRLSKPPHKLIFDYGSVELELKKYQDINIKTLGEVINKIRYEKLPDVNITGNAGSFFKNPIVTNKTADILKKEYVDIPVYPIDKNTAKLSAAWLIDKCGCKGIKKGNVGTHEKQPLVLINLGNATGKEVIELAHYIKKRVSDKFKITLEPEVNIV
ncbi:MAG: UDP-N-acetylmuramate dehydrogenase [Bacteroidales bacterium]|nr:UDP-N-acetylmuramate dehydrogenase [Bacteroidales bacterium]